MFVTQETKARFAGKWQIPLLLVALATLGYAVLKARPTPPRMPVERAVEYIDTLLAGGVNDRAVAFARAAISAEVRPVAERPPLHLRLARAIYADARARNRTTPDVGAEIVAHYQLARHAGETLRAEDHERIGYAFEWQDDPSKAIGHFERAVDAGVAGSDDLERHVVELTLDRIGVPPEEGRRRLDEFLASVPDDRHDLIAWGLERQVYLLQDMGLEEEAASVIARYRDVLKDTPFSDRADWLWALISHREDPDGAERLLRGVLARVAPHQEEHAMAAWLLGRIVLSGDGPQRPVEAMSFFQTVIDHHPDTHYALASEIGNAEALALLERDGEAAATVDRVIATLPHHDSRLVNRDVLRGTLMTLAAARRAEKRFDAGVGYAERAAKLVDLDRVEEASEVWQMLAGLLASNARARLAEADGLESPDADGAERLREEAVESARRAAGVYMDLARINTLNDTRWAMASRDAAEMFEFAGAFDRARELYRDYARERPRDPFAPRALYRIGVIHRRLGDLPAAAEALEQCIAEYPNTLDAAKALLPLADCYLDAGPDQLDRAERTLRRITDDPVLFTPEAPEFEQGLLRLGEVLNRRGAFEEAVTTLEDWRARYGERPADPASLPKVTYLLADSYRRSGVALKRDLADPRFKGQMEQMLEAVHGRLQRASELYRSLVEEYRRRDPATMTARERMYLRHARLYEADCLFELLAYKPALKLYEEAVGAHQDTPSALAAYVQIINCHVFLGQLTEARAALARAEILVDRIPADAFSGPLAVESRGDWKRYFQWLRDTEFLGTEG